MQTHAIQSHYLPAGDIGHPNSHRLRLTADSLPYSQKYTMARSLTIDRIPITPRTAFEVERPQSHGSPRWIINIATSYQQHPRLGRNNKRVPTFPQLLDDKKRKSVPNIKFTSNDHEKGSKIPATPRYNGKRPKPPDNHGKHSPSFRRASLPNSANMSDEKQLWIENWIESTSNALKTDKEVTFKEPLPKEPLPSIEEQQ